MSVPTLLQLFGVLKYRIQHSQDRLVAVEQTLCLALSTSTEMLLSVVGLSPVVSVLLDLLQLTERNEPSKQNQEDCKTEKSRRREDLYRDCEKGIHYAASSSNSNVGFRTVPVTSIVRIDSVIRILDGVPYKSRTMTRSPRL